MSDLISRQAAIDAMTTMLWHYPTECLRNINSYEFAKGLAELGLKSVPSVRSGIIQCKDCRYWDKNKENGYLPGHHYCVMIEEEHKGDFYCGYAKRRTDG